MRFGSPEYFQRLDQQVMAAIAPQVVSGALTQSQVMEIRAEAQRKAHNKVRRFYGMNNKYDGCGRLKAA